MKELSKEDQERIENAANEFSGKDTYNDFSSFESGAKYEHPIARKEGFNEALEEVLIIIENADQDDRYPPGWFSERIAKLKK